MRVACGTRGLRARGMVRGQFEVEPADGVNKGVTRIPPDPLFPLYEKCSRSGLGGGDRSRDAGRTSADHRYVESCGAGQGLAQQVGLQLGLQGSVFARAENIRLEKMGGVQPLTPKAEGETAARGGGHGCGVERIRDFRSQEGF